MEKLQVFANTLFDVAVKIIILKTIMKRTTLIWTLLYRLLGKQFNEEKEWDTVENTKGSMFFYYTLSRKFCLVYTRTNVSFQNKSCYPKSLILLTWEVMS